MTHAMPARAEALDAFAVGETVRITRGALKGLCGTVSSFTAAERCVLDLPGIAPGVQIVIAADAVEVLEAPEK